MARIKQVGTGRKTIGAVDGITYVHRKGVTYARANPIMPASVYKTPAALKRQAIFKMVQMHMKYHLRTIKQTFTPKGIGTPTNRYYATNGKHFTKALDALAELWVAGETVSLADVEAAIAAYATENPQAIVIAKRTGYGEVYLTGAWPQTITLRANGGDSTVIIIVAENGATTTIEPNGNTVVVPGSNGSGANDNTNGNDNQGGSGNSGSGSNTGGGSDPSTGSGQATVEAPTIGGATPFAETTSVTMSCQTAGASIYYTVDGSTPTAASSLYSSAITLNATTTVKAIAVKDGVSSSVTSRTFVKGEGGGEGGEEQ